MDKLPITQNDYDKFVLMTNFLTEFKQKANAMSNVEKVVFEPQVKGYKIAFIYDNIDSEIILFVNKGVFATKLKIEYVVEDRKIKDFVSESEEENREIINSILLNKL